MNFSPDIILLPFQMEFLPEVSVLLTDAYMVFYFSYFFLPEEQSVHSTAQADSRIDDQRIYWSLNQQPFQHHFDFCGESQIRSFKISRNSWMLVLWRVT
jgi:hypothetical protein